MAQFIGSKEEFIKYIGGYCRNKVNALTRNDRLSHNNTCQHCLKSGVELESAHVEGRERNIIIEEILNHNFKVDDNYYNVDLKTFEKLFIELQTPVDEHFIFICKSCHFKYDKRTKISDLPNIIEINRKKSNVIKKSKDELCEKYKNWLEENDYKSGTINQYCRGINLIINEENLASFREVAEYINRLVVDYGTAGIKGHIGEIGHRSVINALRRFKEFLLNNK